MKSRGLGRGLSSLMGESEKSEGLHEVLVNDVLPNPDQPRTNFNLVDLEELQNSIAHNGVLQPILIKPIGDNKYQIIAGERRWRASQMLGLAYIPAIIKEVTEIESLELALIENIQRENLMPLEEAESYKRLMDEYGYTQEKVSIIVSKSRSHVANLLRLFSLSDRVRGYLKDGLINLGHAKLLINAPNADKMADIIIENNLNVRDTEKLISSQKYPASQPKLPVNPRHVALNYDIMMVENSLNESLGLSVKIAHYGNGGSISLYCQTLEQFDMVVRKLTSSL